ncbi:FARSA [Mytilus edulis]|uniref:phenylalanine--tRNA ligase n=1 Tax=Mytilus edulis TaxID=6550 RepID=A0A8S3QAF5_MYTED|nr:FARSA [Mytilus edulis]
MSDNMAETLAEVVLQHVDKKGHINSLELATELKEDHQKIVGAIKSLQSFGELIKAEQIVNKRWELTDEGRDVATNGSHEARVYYAIPDAGTSQAQIMKTVPNAKIGFSKAMQAGWIVMDKKAEGGPKVNKKADKIEDVIQKNLVKLQQDQTDSLTDEQKAEYKKRKLITEVKITSYEITKGDNFSLTIEKPEVDLTPEMLQRFGAKICKQKFDTMPGEKKEHVYDAASLPDLLPIYYKRLFPYGPYFKWLNYGGEPQVSDIKRVPPDYLQRVKRVHAEGGYGSQGYKVEWKTEEAEKNILRTHTTAVSARMLYKLAQQETFTPVKYFSIDRVFRNETTDATHLAEFHQIEGVVADYGLTLGNLMGIIEEFFKKLNITKLRFKPTYNPYTEPSMELFSAHEGKNTISIHFY